jgi:glycerol-3-phosphate acyltransferase PlsY
MKEAAVILLSYLIGSIPMAYALGRALKKIDIRNYGSGNVGASNIWVHVGRWTAIPLAAFDLFVKGALPVYLAIHLNAGIWIGVAAGLATVAGHNWSLYLRFTGGRGINVAMGVLLVLAWKELVMLVLVAAVGWLIFRRSALWVGIALTLLPPWSLLFGEPLSVTVLCVSLIAIVALKRLMANGSMAVAGTRWRDVCIQRLLYDRDIADRDEWVHRTPTEQHDDG